MTSELLDLRPAPDDAGKRALASYVAELAGELAELASSGDLQLIAYFLDMARLECELELRKGGAASGAPPRR